MSKRVLAEFIHRLNEIILRQFHNLSLSEFLFYRAKLPALDFSPIDPIGSRSNGGHLEISSINTWHTAIFNHYSLTCLPDGLLLLPYLTLLPYSLLALLYFTLLFPFAGIKLIQNFLDTLAIGG